MSICATENISPGINVIKGKDKMSEDQLVAFKLPGLPK
jgi:hypothetical protein